MTEVVWNYQDKIAIVTAATAGIGRAITVRLVESGAKVVAAARTRGDIGTRVRRRARLARLR